MGSPAVPNAPLPPQVSLLQPLACEEEEEEKLQEAKKKQVFLFFPPLKMEFLAGSGCWGRFGQGVEGVPAVGQLVEPGARRQREASNS